MSTERSAGAPRLASQSPSGAPFEGLWRRCHVNLLLSPRAEAPALERRAVGLDIIVASPALWAASPQRQEPGWHAQEVDGVVIAERTRG